MTSPETHQSQDERIALPRDIDFDGLFYRLADTNIPLLLYGVGKAKKVQQLLAEIQDGESVMSVDAQGNLYRDVNVVWVDVFCKLTNGEIYKLEEDRQEFRDGRVNRRALGSSLGEKLKPGEDPAEAASRALVEELGIESTPEATYFTGQKEETLVPDTYPGLETSYNFYKYATIIHEDSFVPEGYVEVQPDKINYYLWKQLY